MTPTIATWHPWYHQLLEAAREAIRLPRATPRATPLQELDARTLRDIGIDASEIASIDAESHGWAPVTRPRIVAAAERA